MRFAKKNFTENFIGKHLCWNLFPIKWQDFWLATLLKRESNTSVFLWTFRNVWKCLFWSRDIRKWNLFMLFHEWCHTLCTGKSKEGILKLFYNKRNIVQFKILIQLFRSWKTILWYKKGTLGWNEIRTQKLEK